MTKDQLSPEDRALHDAFFEAYRVKYNELAAAAGDGAETSLDACTVHSIKVMTAREIDRRLAFVTPGKMKESVREMLRQGNGELLARGAEPDHIAFLGEFAAGIAEQTTRLLLIQLAQDPPAPRIVSAVGVGVRVKPPEGAGNICKWVELPELAAFNAVGQQWRTACGHNVAGLAEAAPPALCPFCKGVVA